ncbi:DUF3631 domain-containing protein, partial [Streptomyces sp. NPDC087422]|uniref:DUF3631 domain-containing protein n=1 Tax=Streptomyces sp. NPDC087422 TaxID=3365786 RepID=UPI0038059592
RAYPGGLRRRDHTSHDKIISPLTSSYGTASRVLSDIRRIFARREPDSLTTTDLLAELRADPEAPWGEWGRAGLSARDLGSLLREFGIISGNVRIADSTQRKGYTRSKFLDPWRRYCPTVHPTAGIPAPREG